MDQGAALGTYITQYRSRYFFPTGFEMREWELLDGSKEQIDEKIAPMVLHVDAEEHLDLPKVLEQDHFVDLPTDVQKEYDDIEEGLMSTLFTQPLTTSAAGRSKCMQIANGSVYLDNVLEEFEGAVKRVRPVRVLHTAKIEALVDLYEELQGDPLLLSIGFKHDVTAVRKALGSDIPVLNGDTTDKQFGMYVDAWNNGKLPVMMLHPASAGHALNMQKCHARHVGFFNIPDDYDEYDQVYKRVRRQGNKAGFVMRHRFIARRTVDIPKLRNLKVKGQGQQDFLDAMKAYAVEKYGKDFKRLK